MTRLWGVLPLLVLGTAAAGNADERPADGLAELDGTWTIVRMEIDGRSLLGKDEKWKLVLRDGKVTSDAKQAPREAVDLSKSLDPTRKPKTITYRYEGAITFYGIYEVRGDELRVCGDAVDTTTEKRPESRRPREFDSKKGLLLVFKREKK